MSGEQWACEARLPRGVWGSPQKFLILVGFGNQALTTVVIAPVPVNCLYSQVQVTVVDA